ncbi:MAG: hypothetical protein SH817_15860 [Leptospira sp.]|nr:hypothetical protein [Leptospira sp.]
MASFFLENLRSIASKTWFRFFLVFFLIYKSIFNPFTGDYLIPRLVSQFTNAELEINVKTFSLFFGLDAKDVRLKTKAPFANESLFEAKRLALRYNLLSLIILKLKISEIAIESGTIFLHEKDNVWNYVSIAKPSVVEQELPEEISEPLEVIRTYLPFAAEAHLNISQLHFRILKESEKKLIADIYDLNFRFDFVSNRFTSLPLNADILDQIDSLFIALNPDRSVPIEIESKDLNWKQTLPLSLLFDWKNDTSSPVFLSSSNIGTDQIQLEYKKRPILLGCNLTHHIEFLPDKDELNIKKFSLRIMGDTWLSLKGNIKDIENENRSIDISVIESNIKLGAVNQLLGQLEGILPKMNVNGNVSLQDTKIKGTWKEALMFLRITGQNLSFVMGNAKKHSVRLLDLVLSANLDFGNKQEKTAKNPIPILKSFVFEKINIIYNEIVVNLVGFYDAEENLNLDLFIENLNFSEFTSAVGGKAKASVKVAASDFSYLPLNLDIIVDGFRYALDRSRSPSSKLFLNGNVGLLFNKPFGLTKINLEGLNLSQKTLSGGKALGLDLTGSVGLGSSTEIQTNPLNISLNIPSLLQTLPLVLKEKIAPLQSTLGNDPTLKAKSHISLSDSGQKIEANVTGVIPGLEIKDLNLIADLQILKGKDSKIKINNLSLTAFQKIISINISGLLEERAGVAKAPLGPYFGLINSKLSIKSPEKKYLLRGISFLGDLTLNADIKDFDITGNLISNHSHLFQTNQKCPGSDCKVFLIEDLEANIPFHHSLAWKKQDSLIVGDKSVFIKTYGRTGEPNLKISQIIGTHPSIDDLAFEYVKKQGNAPGLSARINYRENYATIEDLKAYSLDGIVLGKNMIFNVGSADPASMEFRGNVQIRDIDLRQLMAPKVRDKIEDGKLKADLNISVRDLTEPIANMDLFFSIFQIGSDFGKSALNVISPQNFLIDRIADSYAVNTIDVSLSKGLVYADVYFRRSLLSIFVNLEDSKISQQRMPLANFLKRAQSEIQTYQ